MRIKKSNRVALLVLALALAAAGLLSACSGNHEDSRNVVYEDMKASFEQSGLLSSNIGLFSKAETDGSVSYGESGRLAIESPQKSASVNRPGGKVIFPPGLLFPYLFRSFQIFL